MATNLQVQSNIGSTGQYVQDASANNSNLAISSGNIGIGTTDLKARFHVRASDASGTYGGTFAGGTIGLIDATGSASPARLVILKGNGAEILNFGGASSTDEAGIQYDPTTHKLGFKTNNTDNQAVIDGNGNVGIGTTSPSYKLTVATNNSGDGICLAKGDGSMRGFFARAGGGYGFLELYNDSSTRQISLYSNGNSYLNGGNVGIGTTAPQERLHAVGNVRIDDGTGYPGLNRVWTTQKVYNVLDYGAIPLSITPKAWSNTGTISSTTVLSDSTSKITGNNVLPGDTLWIHNNQNCGAYQVLSSVTGSITINGTFNNYSVMAGISWKVTSAATTVDNTAAFNAALSAASAEGGGVVYVPNGYFVFNNNTTSINVPSNVILRGMRSAPPVWMKNFWNKGTPQGPVLLCLSNCGTASGPSFIILSGGINDTDLGAINGSSVIEGLTIFYPIQYLAGATQGTSFSVQSYPYCIEFQANNGINQYNGKGCDNRAMNLTLVNPYQGIKMAAQAVGGRNHLYNIYGCPLYTGIIVNNMGDVTIIEKVFFNPSYFDEFDWTSSDQQRKDWYTYLVQSMTAIIIQSAVFLIIKDVFAIFVRNGMWISSDPTTPSQGSVQGLFGTNIQFDMADCGIYVNLPSNVTSADLELTNVRITCGCKSGSVNDNSVYTRKHCVFGDSSGNNASCFLFLNHGVFQSWLGGTTVLWQIPTS